MKNLIACVYLGFISSICFAEHNVGGGDPLRALFLAAKQQAADVILESRPGDFKPSVDSGRKDWFFQHRLELADDVMSSAHVWVDTAATACSTVEFTPCACTAFTSAAPVTLSFPACDRRIGNVRQAAELLVHETVHHFGIQDESFADEIAATVLSNYIEPDPDFRALQREGSSVIWTGEEIIEWGGIEVRSPMTGVSSTGEVFSPSAKTWAPTATRRAPKPRAFHAAVWSGSKMIIWGGKGTDGLLNDGAIYDPYQERWRSMTTEGAPQARSGASAFWLGDHLLVYGGFGSEYSVVLNDGGTYDPTEDRWTTFAGPHVLGGPYVQQSKPFLVDGALIIFYRDAGSNLAAIRLETTGKWAALDLPRDLIDGEKNIWNQRSVETIGWDGTRFFFLGVAGEFLRERALLSTWDPRANKFVMVGQMLDLSSSPYLNFGGLQTVSGSSFDLVTLGSVVTFRLPPEGPMTSVEWRSYCIGDSCEAFFDERSNKAIYWARFDEGSGKVGYNAASKGITLQLGSWKSEDIRTQNAP